MQIKIYVARFRGSYGIGLSAQIAETNMLDVAHPFPEPYREDDVIYPNPKDRGDALDYATEALEALDKRTAFLAEFRASENNPMVRCPIGVTHVWVDDMGVIRWEGAKAVPPDYAIMKYGDAWFETTASTL